MQTTPFRSYLQLMRLPAVFTAISNIVAAHLIAASSNIHWLALFELLAASSCLYIAGMVINDCFDLEEDRRERPQRPLPSGMISTDFAWLIGFVLLILGVLLAGLVSTLSLLISAALAICIVLYNSILKNTAGAAFTMGLCRYLNWLLGFSFLPFSYEYFLIASPVIFYIISLTRISQEETAAENRKVIFESALWLSLVGLIILTLHQMGILENSFALLPLSAACIVIIIRLTITYRSFSTEKIQQTVKFFIMGVIPLDALLVFFAGPWWGSLLVLSLLIPGILLSRKIYVT